MFGRGYGHWDERVQDHLLGGRALFIKVKSLHTDFPETIKFNHSKSALVKG